MDRNRSTCKRPVAWIVALRKESVDRNRCNLLLLLPTQLSLSARRAWIEIEEFCKYADVSGSLSARRAWIEIACKASITFETWASLSARRAWIEILALDQYLNEQEVSLSARRAWIEIIFESIKRYSPQSLSARRAWIEISVTLNSRNEPQCRSPQGERG